MKFTPILLAAALSLAVSPGTNSALAQGSKPGVERLYIFNCGEGRAGDISRWSPGVNEGKSMDFVDSCYLIKHAQGWLLWDTGVADAIATMPDGQAPSDPRATHWRRPKRSPLSSSSSGSSRPTSSMSRSRTPIPTISAT